MKINSKKIIPIVLVTLLASCGMKEITTEEASIIAQEIAQYQDDNKDNLFKNIYFTSTTIGTNDQTTDKVDEKTEVWYNADKYFLHTTYVKSRNGLSADNRDLYFGKIGDKFYRIDNIKKTYYEYISQFSFEDEIDELRRSLNLGISGSYLKNNFIKEDTDTEKYTYKSNGKGNLLINEQIESSSEQYEITIKFKNYLFASQNATAIYLTTTGTAKMEQKSSAVYSKVSANMPNLKNYTKSY